MHRALTWAKLMTCDQSNYNDPYCCITTFHYGPNINILGKVIIVIYLRPPNWGFLNNLFYDNICGWTLTSDRSISRGMVYFHCFCAQNRARNVHHKYEQYQDVSCQGDIKFCVIHSPIPLTFPHDWPNLSTISTIIMYHSWIIFMSTIY